MKFEDEFPSLKGKVWYSGEPELRQNGIELVDISDIEMFCIDKQKVKEAIEQAKFPAIWADDIDSFKERLKKVLGI
jgi:hypothetical protein